MESLQDLTTSDKSDHEIVISSLPPTPSKSATAFTIEFDDMNNNLLKNGLKKNFGRGSLRDSLRKNAPKKLEKLTKIKPKNNDIKNADSESDLNYTMNSDKNLSDGASFLIERMFSTENTDKKLQNKKTDKVINKNKQLKSRQSPLICESYPLKMQNLNFNNNSMTKTNGLSSSFRSPPLEMDSGVCADEDDSNFSKRENVIDEDALSETGTYTVGELDNQDPIAEEARKRIDEIFGKQSKIKQRQSDSTSNSSTNSSKPTTKQSFKISSIKKNSEETRQNSQCSFKNRNEILSKNSNSSTEQISFYNRRTSLPQNGVLKRQDSFGKSSISRLSLGKKSNDKPSALTNKKSQLSQNISLINQNNMFVFNCNNEPSNSLLNRACANSITRNLPKKLTRKDHLRDDDTGSMKSEEASTGSTDLSSLNSEKCKSDTGQQTSNLRFNRAFALRRARLGIDTPPLTKCNKVKNAANIQKTISNYKSNNLTSHMPMTSTNNHQSRNIDFGLDRSDGGRYSLRASSVSSKPPMCNQRLAIANKSKQHSQQIDALNQNGASSLIGAIIASKSKVANKINKKNSFIDNTDQLKSNHKRANSFGSACKPSKNLMNNQMKIPCISSTASTSSNNTMSNASTSEDLSNISDQINVKNLQHLSPFQLGRRIYSTKPHYMAQTNSFRSKLEENGNLHATSVELMQRDQSQSVLSNELLTSHTHHLESKNKFCQLNINSASQSTNNFNFNNSNIKSLSALDYLVLSAIHQLSFKLRCKLRSILDAEKNKYPIDNENRILIEELLPQVNVTEYRNSETSEKTISRDLSNVLKNLKRIEQSLEVINLLLESNSFMKSIDSSTDLLCNAKDTILVNDDNFSLEI